MILVCNALLWVLCVNTAAWLLGVELSWRVFALCIVATIVDGILEGMWKEEA